MAETRVPAADRRRAGRWGGGTYTIVSRPPSAAVGGEAPEASVEQVEAAAEACAAFPAWSTQARAPGRAAERGRRPPCRAHGGAVDPAGPGRDRGDHPGGVDHPGPDVRRAHAPLRQGRRKPTVDALPPSEMPTTALAPGWSAWAPSPCASRSASSPCITPYNFPIVNMAGKVGPARRMGSTVVVRPAPQDPLAVTRLRRDPRRRRASRRRGQRRHRQRRRRR